MRKIISNTTPILSLLKIDKLEILKELYGKIIIPYAVYLEIENGKHKKYYKDLRQEKWIIIKEITDKKSRIFFLDLDEGETEVLILAKELGADLVILDEIIGRRYAKMLQINLTGTLGILLKAKEKRIIKTIKPLLIELIKKGTWLNKKLMDKVLEIAEEK